MRGGDFSLLSSLAPSLSIQTIAHLLQSTLHVEFGAAVSNYLSHGHGQRPFEPDESTHTASHSLRPTRPILSAMAEHDADPAPPIEEYLRVAQQFRRLSKRMERWRRDYYLSLRPPEKTLRLEKAKLDSKIRTAMADARSCVQSPKLLDRHERALERLIGYADRRRALEPECGCKDRERKETYDRQVNECAQKFPVPNAFIPEDVLAELPPSPTPSPYATSSERARTPPLSDEPADNYRENSPSVQPSTSLSSEVPGGGVGQGPARENDHQDRRTGHASEAVRSPHTAGDSNSAGDGVVTAGTATIAGPEQGRVR